MSKYNGAEIYLTKDCETCQYQHNNICYFGVAVKVLVEPPGKRRRCGKLAAVKSGRQAERVVIERGETGILMRYLPERR